MQQYVYLVLYCTCICMWHSTSEMAISNKLTILIVYIEMTIYYLFMSLAYFGALQKSIPP